MVGLQGQQVGTVEYCGLELESGRVKYVLLTTPWQTLKIPWQSVCVDTKRDRFRLQPAKDCRCARNQESSA